jgi:hypothetical protein
MKDLHTKLVYGEQQREALKQDLYTMLELLEGRPIRPPERTPNVLLDLLEKVIGSFADWILRRIPQYKRVR